MAGIGKALIYIGIVTVALGIILWLASKLGIGFGKLPGDLSFKSGNSSFYFPIATSLIISILLTILLNLFFWIKK